MTAATANLILNLQFRGLLRRTCPVEMTRLEGNVAELGNSTTTGVSQTSCIRVLNEAFWELAASLRSLEVLTNIAPSVLKLGPISFSQVF
jgi:hypothetical protein